MAIKITDEGFLKVIPDEVEEPSDLDRLDHKLVEAQHKYDDQLNKPEENIIQDNIDKIFDCLKSLNFPLDRIELTSFVFDPKVPNGSKKTTLKIKLDKYDFIECQLWDSGKIFFDPNIKSMNVHLFRGYVNLELLLRELTKLINLYQRTPTFTADAPSNLPYSPIKVPLKISEQKEKDSSKTEQDASEKDSFVNSTLDRIYDCLKRSNFPLEQVEKTNLDSELGPCVSLKINLNEDYILCDVFKTETGQIHFTKITEHDKLRRVYKRPQILDVKSLLRELTKVLTEYRREKTVTENVKTLTENIKSYEKSDTQSMVEALRILEKYKILLNNSGTSFGGPFRPSESRKSSDNPRNPKPFVSHKEYLANKEEYKRNISVINDWLKTLPITVVKALENASKYEEEHDWLGQLEKKLDAIDKKQREEALDALTQINNQKRIDRLVKMKEDHPQFAQGIDQALKSLNKSLGNKTEPNNTDVFQRSGDRVGIHEPVDSKIKEKDGNVEIERNFNIKNTEFDVDLLNQTTNSFASLKDGYINWDINPFNLIKSESKAETTEQTKENLFKQTAYSLGFALIDSLKAKKKLADAKRDMIKICKSNGFEITEKDLDLNGEE